MCVNNKEYIMKFLRFSDSKKLSCILSTGNRTLYFLSSTHPQAIHLKISYYPQLVHCKSPCYPHIIHKPGHNHENIPMCLSQVRQNPYF